MNFFIYTNKNNNNNKFGEIHKVIYLTGSEERDRYICRKPIDMSFWFNFVDVPFFIHGKKIGVDKNIKEEEYRAFDIFWSGSFEIKLCDYLDYINTVHERVLRYEKLIYKEGIKGINFLFFRTDVSFSYKDIRRVEERIDKDNIMTVYIYNNRDLNENKIIIHSNMVITRLMRLQSKWAVRRIRIEVKTEQVKKFYR